MADLEPNPDKRPSAEGVYVEPTGKVDYRWFLPVRGLGCLIITTGESDLNDPPRFAAQGSGVLTLEQIHRGSL